MADNVHINEADPEGSEDPAAQKGIAKDSGNIAEGLAKEQPLARSERGNTAETDLTPANKLRTFLARLLPQAKRPGGAEAAGTAEVTQETGGVTAETVRDTLSRIEADEGVGAVLADTGLTMREMMEAAIADAQSKERAEYFPVPENLRAEVTEPGVYYLDGEFRSRAQDQDAIAERINRLRGSDG